MEFKLRSLNSPHAKIYTSCSAGMSFHLPVIEEVEWWCTGKEIEK